MYLNTAQKWQAILKKVEEGVKAIFPIEAKTGKIELIKVEIPNNTNASISAQKDRLLTGTTLGTPVYGTFRLVKNDGKTETNKVKLIDLPILTDRGTFIVQGKDYSVFNQVRLRPGCFVRKTNDSDEVFAQFNLAKGLGFKLYMDNNGVFYVRFDKSALSKSSKRIPLYSLLHALGTSDGEIQGRWGDTVFKNNIAKSNPDDVKAIIAQCIYPTKRTGNDNKDLQEYFKGNILNEETTRVTLGHAYQTVTPQAILDATVKMVRVYNNKADEDDLDSLLFKEVLGVEDHLMLRIEKKAKEEGLIYKVMNRIDAGYPLKSIILPNFLTKLIEGFFTKSSLSAPQTEINPIEILETGHKITAMGEGGIGSDRAIPMSARNLHPSHFGYLDPVRTTESERVGVDLRTTLPTVVKDRNIYSEFIDRSGKKVMLKPMDLVDKVIAFPGQEQKQTVRVLLNGHLKEMSRNKVDYWVPKSSNMFTVTTNLVPFLHNDQGNRVTMAGRMVTQAVPLVHREAPLVQIRDQSGEYNTIQERYGKEYFVPKSPEDGTVTEVTKDYIKVNNTKVEIYNNFPLNLKTFLTMYPLVKVGDKVKKGQVLADSNFTKGGELALGTNLNVAYIPYKGYTHEDSIVISESTAKKLTSQHMYTCEVETDVDTLVDKGAFIKWFPTKITPANIAKLSDDGVIKKDSKVIRGDVLIAGMRYKTLTSSDNMLRRLRGSLVNPYKDASEKWEHDAEGTVVEVVRKGKLIRVVVVTEDSAKRGDKISGLHGNKGTIGLILPDAEMPVDKNGKPVDAMLNPASVPSRVNPGQMYEALEGKRALTEGHKVVIDNFDSADSSKKVLNQLKQEGIDVEETLYDPKTKRPLGKVFTGTPYFIKLHKQTEGNFSSLYRGAYDANNQPIKGGEEGSKGVGQLDVYALLGHNARNNLAEMATYKSDKNDDFWNSLEAGIAPAPAKEPFAFKKFKSLVTAAGIGIKSDDNAMTLAPLNDKMIMDMSSGAIRKGAILENHMGKDRPESGGIFDPVVTGGLKGQQWSHVNLAAPIVNPLFEGVVSTLLHRDISGENGKTIQKELAAINVPKRIGEVSAALKVATGSNRNKLLKELKYLTALKKANMNPADYVLTKFPIIPPQFRPIYNSQTGGLPMVADVNYLYKDLLNVNEKLDNMKDYPDSEKGALLKDLRQSAQAIVGLMAPVNKQNEKRGVTGFLPQLTGSNYQGQGTSKESFFHRKILKRQQTLTGRGTIGPDPTLNVDNIKIPWEMAWKIYQPFVIAEFRKRGINILKAREEIKNRTPVAKQLLEIQMRKRPVLLNRAPTLHKYNIMAFTPLGTEGKTIYVPPLVIKGFAADFDGDSVAGDTQVLVQDLQGNITLKQIKDVE